LLEEMNMCVRPGSESPTEELDDALWKRFRMWKARDPLRADDDGNGVEEFCACVRTRLEKLVRERADA
jgi:hypothetical protein